MSAKFYFIDIMLIPKAASYEFDPIGGKLIAIKGDFRKLNRNKLDWAIVSKYEFRLTVHSTPYAEKTIFVL